MELNTFSNMEQNDDHTYSTDYPLFQSENAQQEQTFKDASNCSTEFSPNVQKEELLRNKSNHSNMENPMDMLSEFYAELLVTIAGISIFIEIIPGPIRLFQGHVYVFTALLAAGIVFLLHGFIRRLNYKYFQEERDNIKTAPKCLVKCSQNDKPKDFFRLFLKFGILLFGLGVLISTGLGSIAILVAPKSCVNELSSALPIVECIFIFLEMIFIITYSIDIGTLFGSYHKIIIKHLIATNGALWIRMFLWESAKDWEDVLHFKPVLGKKWDQDINITVHALVPMNMTSPNHAVHITSNCWWKISEFNNIEDITAVDLCIQNSTLGSISGKASRFLYPFMVQYYIIAIYFLCLICCNFKQASVQQHHQSVLPCDNSHKGSLCSRSTKGFSLGFLVLASAIVYVILYQTLDNLKFNVILMSEYCFIFGLSILAGMMCLFQIKNMILRKDSYDFQLKLMQKIGALVIYVHGVCNIIVGTYLNENFSLLLLAEGVLMIIQVTVQYILILTIDTKRVDQLNINEKPGRQAVGFLVLCNISLWLLDCFVSWNNVQNHLQFKMLGAIAWNVISRILFPFIAFYRFHSAVVLFEAWKSCYF